VDPAFVAQLAAKYKPQTEAFYFAAIGDQQYGADGEAKWPALSASIQADPRLQFVVHIGDIWSGATKCTDARYDDRLQLFNTFRIPFILTPGDNEWTDCGRQNDDPLERLAKLRTMFFDGDSSLGQRKLALTRQSQDQRYSLYRENALWTQGGVVFATLHIVGSNNNFSNKAEFEARNRANMDWVRTAFALAKANQFDAVVLAFQADPAFPLTGAARAQTTAGFTDTLRVLLTESQAFGRPVLAIHGDSHFFRFDKPLPREDGKVLDNFFRLEVPGDADAHWVRVDMDPTTPGSPFRVQHITVPDNANR
jgi:hypothetical protein